MGLKHSTSKSFKYAVQGIKTAFRNEPNLRIHTAIAAVVLFLAYFFDFSPFEWLLLAFTIFFVIIVELLNTVLEALVDLVSPEINPTAKIAKDVSAACVLFAAAMSVIVGLILFIPKLLKP